MRSFWYGTADSKLDRRFFFRRLHICHHYINKTKLNETITMTIKKSKKQKTEKSRQIEITDQLT